MKKYLSPMLLALASTSLAETPHSIVGVWQFDSTRTMLEHIESIKAPENIDQAKFAEQIADTKNGIDLRAPEVDSQVTLTITQDSITFLNESSGTNTFSYKIVGGNSTLVVIQLSDKSGYEGIGKIRLVSNGIALEQTDCDTYPRQCEYERKRALADMRKKSEGAATVTVIDGLSTEPLPSRNNSPKLIYFKPGISN